VSGEFTVCGVGWVRVVFVTIYICTINLFLLFNNTTGMTHLKETLYSMSKLVGINAHCKQT